MCYFCQLLIIMRDLVLLCVCYLVYCTCVWMFVLGESIAVICVYVGNIIEVTEFSG